MSLTLSRAKTRSMRFALAGGAEDGRHEVAGFGHDLVPAHGVLGGAAHGVDALGEASSVRKRKLDNGDALGQELFEVRIGDELNLGALAKDRGVAHARVIVRGAEGSGLIEEHDGQHVLQADVRDVAVIDDRGFVGGDAHGDLLDLIGLEGMLFAQTFERIEGRLNGRSDGPLFDVGARDLVALAQLVDRVPPDRL